MHIIVLGGTNDNCGILSESTKKRIEKCYAMLDGRSNVDVHFSGGFNERYNPTNVPHSKLCMNYFEEVYSVGLGVRKRTHVGNNSTVDEALHFSKYFENSEETIKIVTNDWHMRRVECLFAKTFEYYGVRNYELVSVESGTIDETVLQSETGKVERLIERPYGRWKDWLVNKYYDKFLSLRLTNRNDCDGRTIVSMRNENNESFFNSEKFEWESFKTTFYSKYFSNEIPPFFVCLKDDVVGFIGCKTVGKGINDIGIMLFKRYQNRGLGKASLTRFLKTYNKRYHDESKVIVSQILKSNIGSYKVFIANGFELDKDKTTESTYYLTYCQRCASHNRETTC